MEIWQFTQATIDDLESTAILFDLYRQFYEQQPNIQAATRFIAERLEKKDSIIYLAVDVKQSKAVGFVQLYPSFSSVSMKRLWILNDLFVLPDYRKKGVGKGLIQSGVTLCMATNAKGLMLETAVSNTSAQSLYEELGFKRSKDDFYTYYLEV